MAENPDPSHAEPKPGAVPESKNGAKPADLPKEIGGPTGPEPTRYGDWERAGRCSDF